MIRFTSEGPTVWFELSGQPGKKITWTLADFLRYVSHVKLSKTAADYDSLGAELFHAGKIEDLTEADCDELQSIFSDHTSVSPALRERNSPTKGEKVRSAGA